MRISQRIMACTIRKRLLSQYLLHSGSTKIDWHLKNSTHYRNIEQYSQIISSISKTTQHPMLIQNLKLCVKKKTFPRFIIKNKWQANSPDLDMLYYHVWHGVENNMHWTQIYNYDSLESETRKAIDRVSHNDLFRIVDDGSSRILQILQTNIEHVMWSSISVCYSFIYSIFWHNPLKIAPFWFW